MTVATAVAVFVQVHTRCVKGESASTHAHQTVQAKNAEMTVVAAVVEHVQHLRFVQMDNVHAQQIV